MRGKSKPPKRGQTKLAPFSGAVRPKKMPRGKPFPKGHSIGAATRFVKGHSHPGGRAKSAEISKALRELLASDKPIVVESLSGAEAIAWQWYQQARDGHLGAIVSLADRVEGRPSVSIGIQGENSLDVLILAMSERSREIGPPEGQLPLDDSRLLTEAKEEHQ